MGGPLRGVHARECLGESSTSPPAQALAQSDLRMRSRTPRALHVDSQSDCARAAAPVRSVLARRCAVELRTDCAAGIRLRSNASCAVWPTAGMPPRGPQSAGFVSQWGSRFEVIPGVTFWPSLRCWSVLTSPRGLRWNGGLCFCRWGPYGTSQPKVDLHAAIRRDHQEGMSQRALQRKHYVTWRTVRRALDRTWGLLPSAQVLPRVYDPVVGPENSPCEGHLGLGEEAKPDGTADAVRCCVVRCRKGMHQPPAVLDPGLFQKSADAAFAEALSLKLRQNHPTDLGNRPVADRS